MAEKWEPQRGNWQSIGKDAAAEMLNLAEKRLNETIATNEHFKKKAELLRSISLPVLTVAVGYIFTYATTARSSDDSSLGQMLLFSLAIAVILPLCGVLYFVARILVHGEELSVPGASPSTMLTQKRFVDSRYDEDEQFVDLALDVLEQYQERIDKNREINKGIKIDDSGMQICFYLAILAVLAVLFGVILASLISKAIYF
jgi:hypothetical protein